MPYSRVPKVELEVETEDITHFIILLTKLQRTIDPLVHNYQVRAKALD